MARITAKSKIKPDGYYTIWFRHKNWPRTGPGSYVIERTYGGRTILYDWDDLQVGKYRSGGRGGYFVYPQYEDPTKRSTKKKATKKKAAKKKTKKRRPHKLKYEFPDEYELQESYVINNPAWGSMTLKHPGLGRGRNVAGFEEAVALIADAMDEEGFYPEIYYINERGNVDLIEKITGQTLASWV